MDLLKVGNKAETTTQKTRRLHMLHDAIVCNRCRVVFLSNIFIPSLFLNFLQLYHYMQSIITENFFCPWFLLFLRGEAEK